jgi:hypothetical protein
MAGNHRFCARCQYKHASPTGKKCRRPILEPVADPAPEGAVGGDLPEQPEMLDFFLRVQLVTIITLAMIVLTHFCL